ncbi:MAG: aminotransferase class I/II-fold pyridoxal phosphate-dependent enzyme [Hyphomicrobiaceae bacterium]
MKFSALVERIQGEATDAWAIHSAAAEAKRRGEDVIVLSIGDPDFSTPARFIDRAVEAMRTGDTHYADVEGRPELRAAIAERFASRTGVAVGPQNVVVTAGCQNALFGVTQCLAEPECEIVVLEPMYVTYDATIRATGARLVTSPQRPETGFRVDLEALQACITPATRAIYFATPNNPTGAVMTRGELEGIAEIARRHDIWVVADEVYADLTFEREHVSIAALPGMAERTATLSSLSKSHAMTGWRSGWIIGPGDLVEHVGRLNLAMTYGLPGFIQEAAVTALREGDEEVARMREIYRRRRDLMLDALKDAPLIRCLTPEAGMFMLIDVGASGLSANEFSWALFREEGVGVLDASPFGPSARGFLRVAFTIGEAELAEAARRITRFSRRLAAAAEGAAGDIRRTG